MLSVIIPVYNEEKTIRDVVNKIKDIPIEKEIVLVNDGSRDGSAHVLDGLRDMSGPYVASVMVVHKPNGGKGSALKAGIAAATGSIIIFQDADLEYDPQDYAAMIQPIVDGRVKVVIGARFRNRQNIWVGQRPSWRYIQNRLGLHAITWLTNILYLRNMSDYEGCYKAFDAKLLKAIPAEANGFEIDNELICKIFRMGYPVEEVPIHYYPRSYEEGKKIKTEDGIRILQTIVKWRFKHFNMAAARNPQLQA